MDQQCTTVTDLMLYGFERIPQYGRNSRIILCRRLILVSHQFGLQRNAQVVAECPHLVLDGDKSPLSQ